MKDFYVDKLGLKFVSEQKGRHVFLKTDNNMEIDVMRHRVGLEIDQRDLDIIAFMVRLWKAVQNQIAVFRQKVTTHYGNFMNGNKINF